MSASVFMILLAPALLMVAPVIEALTNLGVPLISTAASLFLGGLFLIGLLASVPAAAFHALRGRSGPVEVLEAMATAGVLLLVADVTWQGHALLALSPLGQGAFGKIATLAIAGLLLTVVVWVLRRPLPLVMFVGAMAMVGTGVVANVVGQQSSDELRPMDEAATGHAPLVYIVFDEMVGLGGIDRAIEGGEELYARMHEVFAEHGFRLFEKAYSRHNVTAKAMPAVLNFDEHDNESYGFRSKYYRSVEKESLGQNALFAQMADEGRHITVFQTAHLDYCSSGEDPDCHTFQSFNPINEDVPGLASTTKAVFDLLLAAYDESYVITRYVEVAGRVIDREGATKPIHFDVYAFPNWFGKFEQAVTENFERGRVFFGHFLMPHAPYVYDRACKLHDRWMLPWFLSDRLDLSGQELEEARVDYYEMYFEQAECALIQLDGMLDDLENDSLYEEATIVVQGDHGSRLSATMYAEDMTERDMLDNYPALYAIRAPRVAPGIDDRKVSIQRLSAEFFSGKGAEELGPARQDVAIDSREIGEVEVRPMPDFGS